MGSPADSTNPPVRARRRGRHAAAVTSLTVAVVVIAACAPTPTPASQVPNPAPSDVVAEDLGGGTAPDHRDVPYAGALTGGCGSGSEGHAACGGSQSLDVYRHRVPHAARGTIVYIHGGGFVGGDKSDTTGLGPLFHQLGRGWDIVSVNYRLTRGGTAQWPAAVEDVEAAIRWIRVHGAAVGVDTTRVVTFGHSAGGTLAALAGVAWNTGDPAYASVARVDGWIDMAGIDDFSIRGGGTAMWGTSWSGHLDDQARRMSPITFVDAGDPPGYLIHGDADPIVEVLNAHRTKSAADARGARVQLDVVDAWQDLTWLPQRFRGHVPAGGVNASALDAFLDGI